MTRRGGNIPRGADLTDEDLRVLVDDFYDVRNWAALKMHMGVPEMKEQLFQALRARLGRRPLVENEGALRRKDPQQLSEEEAILELYRQALGM